ncbi:phosphate ABC transporter substrate-binding protein [Ramlibacter sp. G-1-2-2]|uniref:Phosphate ABC transporter substrate-binding protein n=1 Tax=Ramlibacter agri TaxID=2728837 RepID=A0A848GU48_9BURK|nr:phosphate ABC transporter substrate-binding protein [Ramlibacter agri]NML42146.1 phosphate ABC transporter substrate-binding protein [Ramlibacter agri]
MRPIRFLAVAATAFLMAAQSPAADVYLVANPSLGLGEDDIRDIYLGDKQLANGTRIVPLDNAALQRDFLEKALKMDGAKYSSIWIKKGFRDGLNAPTVKTGDAEVLAAVKSNPGAIGYVSAPPKDLKVIAHY